MYKTDASGKMVINEAFMQGLIRGIWSKFDINNDGFLNRSELRLFFEDFLASAGMKGTIIK